MSARATRQGRSPAREKKSEGDSSSSPTKKAGARPGRSKSPGRPKSPGHPKSPARTKSPSRGRPKSPVKPKKSSTSPFIEKRVLSEKVTAKKKVSPIRVSPFVYVSLKKEEFEKSPSVSIIRSDIKKDVDASNYKGRISSSIDTTSTIRRLPRLVTKKDTDGDIDEFIGRSSASLSSRAKSVEKSSQVPREFGGWIGALIFIIALPLTPLAVQMYCSKDNCGTTFRAPTNWRAYFDLEAAGWYLAFIGMQIIFSYLPLGKVVDAQPPRSSRYQYRCNGIVSLVLTLSVLGGLWYFKYPLTRVLDKQLQLTVTAIIFGLLLSIVLYIRSKKAPVSSLNQYGISGNFLRDFWMGREINPRFGRLDIKMFLFRSTLIAIVVLHILFVFKVLDSQTVRGDGGVPRKVDWAQKEYPPALLLAVGLHLVYMLDSLWLEYTFLTTFEVMSEGCGYMLAAGYSVYPFFATVITKFLVFNKVDTPWYGLTAIGLVFTIGYVFYRASNQQKNNFRQNPLDPALAHLERITTSRGKELLVSGWWGFVRHPNYLGDIIMHWAIASVCGCAHWLPYTLPLMTTLSLIHRSIRDDARCKQRYGIYWDRYTSRVKSRLIPKVF